MITAFVLIKVDKGKIQDVASTLSAFEEVKEVYSVTGEYDLVAKVQVKEYENMSDIVTDKFQKINEIVSTKTMMAFKTYKFMDLTEAFAPPVYPGPPQQIPEEGRDVVKPILSKLTQGIDLGSREVFSFIEAVNRGGAHRHSDSRFFDGTYHKRAKRRGGGRDSKSNEEILYSINYIYSC